MKYLLMLFLLAALVFSGSAAFADNNALTFDEFQKTLHSKKDTIQMVNITNGQNLFDVKLNGEQVDKTVDVPAEQRKPLIQRLLTNKVPITVHDNLVKWIGSKFGQGATGLSCSQLANLIAENKTNSIEHVDSINNSNILLVKMSGGTEQEVVLPSEIKQEMVDELSQKGLKVERKEAKQDYSLILPAFIAGVVLLGIVYMLVPMKLASEVNPRPTVVNASAENVREVTKDDTNIV